MIQHWLALLVVDPVEAENEARRVQFVAAQQLVDPDEADGIDFLADLAQFAEPDVAVADGPAADGLADELPDAAGHAAAEDDAADCRDPGVHDADDWAVLDGAIDADEAVRRGLSVAARAIWTK